MELSVDATFAATLVGIISIVNGLSGLSMGVVYDKKGLQFSMILVATIAFAACTVLACAFFFGLGWLYVIGCLMMVVGYGSVAPPGHRVCPRALWSESASRITWPS